MEWPSGQRRIPPIDLLLFEQDRLIEKEHGYRIIYRTLEYRVLGAYICTISLHLHI